MTDFASFGRKFSQNSDKDLWTQLKTMNSNRNESQDKLSKMASKEKSLNENASWSHHKNADTPQTMKNSRSLSNTAVNQTTQNQGFSTIFQRQLQSSATPKSSLQDRKLSLQIEKDVNQEDLYPRTATHSAKKNTWVEGNTRSMSQLRSGEREGASVQEARGPSLYQKLTTNYKGVVTRVNSQNRKNQSSIDLSHSEIRIDLNQSSIAPQSVKGSHTPVANFQTPEYATSVKHSAQTTNKTSNLSQFLSSNVKERLQQQRNQGKSLSIVAGQRRTDAHQMSKILSYEIEEKGPSEEFYVNLIKQLVLQEKQMVIDMGPKYDINKNLHESLVGGKLNKEQLYSYQPDSGLVGKKVIDACFEDLLSGDPIKKVHDQRLKERFDLLHASSTSAHNRTLLNNPSTILSEKRKSSLVPQSKFQDLEIIKKQAASAWLQAYHQQYKHEMTLEEKRYLWNMQKLEAMKAKEQTKIDVYMKQQYPAKPTQQRLVQQKESSISSISNNKLKISFTSFNQSCPSSPYTQKSSKDHFFNRKSTISGAATNFTTPKNEDTGSPFQTFKEMSKKQLQNKIEEERSRVLSKKVQYINGTKSYGKSATKGRNPSRASSIKKS